MLLKVTNYYYSLNLSRVYDFKYRIFVHPNFWKDTFGLNYTAKDALFDFHFFQNFYSKIGKHRQKQTRIKAKFVFKPRLCSRNRFPLESYIEGNGEKPCGNMNNDDASIATIPRWWHLEIRGLLLPLIDYVRSDFEDLGRIFAP
jgi:hypothetical protein